MAVWRRRHVKDGLQLREKDHEPMHVHLVGGKINAKFDLVTLQLVSGKVSGDLLSEVMIWLKANQNGLIEEWRKWQS